MAKFFGNLHLVLLTGLVLAVIVMVQFSASAPVDANSVLRWLHAFFGILWIGLLYYLNFVQVPTMPKIPAELKKGVTGFIAPNVFFFFRYGALLTVLTGLAVAIVSGYAHQAFTFSGVSYFLSGRPYCMVSTFSVVQPTSAERSRAWQLARRQPCRMRLSASSRTWATTNTIA